MSTPVTTASFQKSSSKYTDVQIMPAEIVSCGVTVAYEEDFGQNVLLSRSPQPAVQVFQSFL